MDGLVDYVRRQVKCPECRAEHRIPYQVSNQFSKDLTKLKLRANVETINFRDFPAP